MSKLRVHVCVVYGFLFLCVLDYVQVGGLGVCPYDIPCRASVEPCVSAAGVLDYESPLRA